MWYRITNQQLVQCGVPTSRCNSPQMGFIHVIGKRMRWYQNTYYSAHFLAMCENCEGMSHTWRPGVCPVCPTLRGKPGTCDTLFRQNDLSQHLQSKGALCQRHAHNYFSFCRIVFKNGLCLAFSNLFSSLKFLRSVAGMAAQLRIADGKRLLINGHFMLFYTNSDSILALDIKYMPCHDGDVCIMTHTFHWKIPELSEDKYLCVYVICRQCQLNPHFLLEFH